MTDQDAIEIKVFKAKYFSNGYFLSSSLGNNPRFTWLSIYVLRLAVREGIR